MARPTKQGLDYFPFDVGFFGDNKIRILITRYQSEGLAVYLYILCDIYKEGYYKSVEDMDDYIYIIADAVKTSPDKVQQIIAFLRKRAMVRIFEKDELTVCDLDAVITSHGIQRRYAEAIKSRKKSISDINSGYWLLSENEEAEINAFYKSTKNEGFSENNPSFSEKNPDKSEKNSINKSKVISTDVPRARSAAFKKFFEEFPQLRTDGTDDFSGIDFEKLSEKFRQSKKWLQTSYSWKWVLSNYKDIIAGKFDDHPESENSGKHAEQLSEAVKAANARADREQWYSRRRAEAERKAEAAQEQARRFPEYREAEKALKRLEIEHAKAELYEPEKVPEIEAEQETWRKKKASELFSAGISEADLLPEWHCKKCEDTGFLPGGKMCDCYGGKNADKR